MIGATAMLSRQIIFMSEKFFKKETVSHPVFDDKGVPVQFETIGGGIGVIRLNPDTDAPKIALLEKMAAARQAGVVIISPEIYESLKKKEPVLMRSPDPLKQQGLRVHQMPNLFQQRSTSKDVAPAATAEVDPAVPSPAPSRQSFLARTRKASTITSRVFGADGKTRIE